MIRSFGDAITEALYDGIENARSRRVPPHVRRVILRKLDMVAAAAELGINPVIDKPFVDGFYECFHGSEIAVIAGPLPRHMGWTA